MSITNDWKWTCSMCGAKTVVPTQNHTPSMWRRVKLVYDDVIEGETMVICASCMGASGAAGAVQKKKAILWLMTQFKKLRIRGKKTGNKVPRR